MAWLFDLVLTPIADIFGYQLGRDKRWWVEMLASLGCLAILSAAALLLLWLAR